jgi:hypothetical protein
VDRRRLLRVVVVALAAALLLESVALAVQWRGLAASRQREAATRRELADAQRRLAELERARGATGGSGGATGDLLDRLGELLGGGDAGGLGDLLGGGTEAAACAEALADAAPGGPSAGGQDQAGDPAAQVRAIARTVERLRGLRFRRLPRPTFVSQGELGRRAAASVEEYPAAQANADGRALAALGALPPGSDLKALLRKALGSSVAGFYDPESGELVVGSPGAGAAGAGRGLGPAERVTLAHELEHALADQRLGLPAAVERPPAGQADAALGALAVVEGDATLTMQRYSLASLGLADQLSMLAQALPAQGQLDRLPAYLGQRLTFPYLQGMAFVCGLHADGGWAAVDRAYDQPPATSAQVLFPERYAAGERAVDPRDPPAPPAPWRQAGRETFGAADLLWLFQAPGGDKGRALEGAMGRVAAWAGGELVTFADGDRTAVGLALAEHAGTGGLCGSMQAWYQAAFPEGRAVAAAAGEALARQGRTGHAVLRCQGGEVRLGVAPDLATARALAA